MAGRRRGAHGRPPHARAADATLPAGRSGALGYRPSARSLLVGIGLVALAGGAYAVARETAMFAIASIEVAGAPPDVRAQARRAAAPLLGTSLVALDGGALERRLASVPTIVSAEYDRAFPHTLRLRVVPEVPVAVLRSGRRSWIVSARGRVIRRVSRRESPALPRIWLPHAAAVAAGGFLPDRAGIPARALALAARFPGRIAAARLAHGELVFRLRSGVELRLGRPADVRLKLAIARRALPALPAGTAYLDVSVPQRPVGGPAGPNPRVSGGG